MKLAKQIAALGLTGAMAMTLLVGCGGTSAGKTQEEPGLNKTAPAIPETAAAIELEDSMYDEVVRVVNSETYHMQLSWTESDETTEVILAKKDAKWYLKMSRTSADSYYRSTSLCDGTGAYLLEMTIGDEHDSMSFPGDKVALEMEAEDLIPNVAAVVGAAAADPACLKSIVAGSATVSEKVYYSETVTTEVNGNTSIRTYCFEGNQLKYWIDGTETDDAEAVYKIDCWTTTVSDSLFEIPSDYTIIRLDEVKAELDEEAA